eukprot:6260852-Heterocapsa_arctica.AAC.1
MGARLRRRPGLGHGGGAQHVSGSANPDMEDPDDPRHRCFHRHGSDGKELPDPRPRRGRDRLDPPDPRLERRQRRGRGAHLRHRLRRAQLEQRHRAQLGDIGRS